MDKMRDEISALQDQLDDQQAIANAQKEELAQAQRDSQEALEALKTGKEEELAGFKAKAREVLADKNAAIKEKEEELEAELRKKDFPDIVTLARAAKCPIEPRPTQVRGVGPAEAARAAHARRRPKCARAVYACVRARAHVVGRYARSLTGSRHAVRSATNGNPVKVQRKERQNEHVVYHNERART